MSTVWVTLSGGKSARFGSPKQWAMRNGITFLDISIKRVKGMELAGDHTVVCVANKTDIERSVGDQAVIEADVSVLIDDPICSGPVAGLLASVRHALLIGADALVFQPIDMPCLSVSVLANLRLNAIHSGAISVAMGADSRDIAWTLGAIPAVLLVHVEHRIIHLVEEMKGESYSSPGLKNVISGFDFIAMPTSDDLLSNVNTPDDLSSLDN